HDGSTDPAGQATAMSDGGWVELASGFPPETVRALMDRGHSVRSALGPFGGSQATKANPRGGWTGASESRQDGHAAGYRTRGARARGGRVPRPRAARSGGSS